MSKSNNHKYLSLSPLPHDQKWHLAWADIYMHSATTWLPQHSYSPLAEMVRHALETPWCPCGTPSLSQLSLESLCLSQGAWEPSSHLTVVWGAVGQQGTGHTQGQLGYELCHLWNSVGEGGGAERTWYKMKGYTYTFNHILLQISIGWCYNNYMQNIDENDSANGNMSSLSSTMLCINLYQTT